METATVTLTKDEATTLWCFLYNMGPHHFGGLPGFEECRLMDEITEETKGELCKLTNKLGDFLNTIDEG